MKWLSICICSFFALFSYERASSYPYLSGDTWRYFSDWRLSKEEGFNPTKVQLGDVVFVTCDKLPRFRKKYLPKIKNRFILITPNCESGGDDPQPGRFASMLKSKKLAAWFVQNIDRSPTERIIPIPIGIANQVWPHGQIAVLDPKALKASSQGNVRDQWIYINFTVETNPAKRRPCLEYFQSFMDVNMVSGLTFDAYLDELARSVFVVSPPGNGQDCHRTWEALLMGCYPIVVSSTLNPLYEDLPVVVINSWEEVTEEFLQKKKQEFDAKAWNKEKLYAPYWYKKVTKIQDELRKNPTFMEKFHAWFRK